MSGEDLDVRRKGKEAIERVEKLPIVTSGQVRSTIAHFEERVAGEEDSVLREIETDTAGGMAGGG